MAEIWLIRHGQAGDVMGEYDLLSERGWAQSRHTGGKWAHLTPVTHVLSGAMRRHRETLQGFAETYGDLPEAVIDDGWNEFDHQNVIRVAIAGGLSPDAGKGKAGFFNFFHAAMGRWSGGEFDSEYNEAYSAFQGRVEASFEALSARLGSGERALVFTSGGAISAVVRRLLGTEPAAAFRVNTVLVNTGLTLIRVGQGRESLVSLNVHTHFDDAPELLSRA